MSQSSRNQSDVRRGPHLIKDGVQTDRSDRLVKFKLTEDLVEGQSAAAYLMPWNDADEQYDDPAEEDRTAITVKDYRGMGLAGPEDTEGMALRRFTDNGIIYEITELFWKAHDIDFELDAGFDTGDQTVSATVERYYGGGVDPGTTVTLYNRTASAAKMFEGDAGDEGMAVYNEHLDRYYIRQLECP